MPKALVRSVFYLGGIRIQFEDTLTAEEASDRVRSCTCRRSHMYRGIIGMLKKQPHERNEFEQLVREELGDWEPLHDDYEMNVAYFTDFKL